MPQPSAPRFPDSIELLQRRAAGLLVHVSSLPGAHGIGDLGPAAYAWIDQLTAAGLGWWQMLPLTPPGDGNSPYQSFSAFAGNPAFISPELLVRDGLLLRQEVAQPPALLAGRADRVNFRVANRHKGSLLLRAFERFKGGAAASKGLGSEFHRFRVGAAGWLDDYALFMSLRDAHQGASWADWPRPLVLRKPAALAEARRALREQIERHSFVQWLFARQWAALREHGRLKGVRLIGDLPIYVSGDSADVWANPHLFQLDSQRRPRAVAGVPPDLFSVTGQRWGNPLYDWPAMEREGFAWWTARFRSLLRGVDLVRVDHFRGFAAYWRIPADAPTAQSGHWVEAPGKALFAALRRELGGLPLIAEDLGVITPDVEKLRDDNRLPGTRVLQFGFDGNGHNVHLPHNHPHLSAAYTGTHDNDTAAGWYCALKGNVRAIVRGYAPDAAANPAAALLRLTWSSPAGLAIAPVQDVLELGSRARMNTPGRASGNWTWRMSAPLGRPALDRLRELTQRYGRSG